MKSFEEHVRYSEDGKKFIGLPLPYNFTNNNPAPSKHYIAAWQGYAVVVSCKDPNEKANKKFSLA